MHWAYSIVHRMDTISINLDAARRPTDKGTLGEIAISGAFAIFAGILGYLFEQLQISYFQRIAEQEISSKHTYLYTKQGFTSHAALGVWALRPPLAPRQDQGGLRNASSTTFSPEVSSAVSSPKPPVTRCSSESPPQSGPGRSSMRFFPFKSCTRARVSKLNSELGHNFILGLQKKLFFLAFNAVSRP